MCYLQSNYNLTTLLGNLFATIANLDQDAITSMDSCKIGEALTDKCHQPYSTNKTRYRRINDMANEDKELLSLRSEVELDDALDSVCDHHFKMYGSCYASAKRIIWTHFRNTRKNVQVRMPRTLSYSGQLLDSSLTDRLDMVSVKDESNN